MADQKKKPERVFRIANVSALIFVQSAGQDRTFRTINLQRSWVDEEQQRQYSGSLTLADLPAAIEVLKLAQDYVATEKEEALVV